MIDGGGLLPTAIAETADIGVGIPRQSAVGVRPSRTFHLMERYASGDDAVFDQLYELLAPRLYRFWVRLARMAPEADDIFQETFLKLHRARATYLTGADPIPWAFAIARSVYLSRLRYRRRHRDEVGATADVAEGDGPVPSHSTPEAEILAEHMLDVVTVELSRMSEKNRVAYVLLKEENLSVKDAAAVLGTTCDVVKQRAHRAYQQLKAALDAAGWGEHGSWAT
jgi:RNA polymerase sigma-70 factor (ECF subfamily)